MGGCHFHYLVIGKIRYFMTIIANTVSLRVLSSVVLEDFMRFKDTTMCINDIDNKC